MKTPYASHNSGVSILEEDPAFTLLDKLEEPYFVKSIYIVAFDILANGFVVVVIQRKFRQRFNVF